MRKINGAVSTNPLPVRIRRGLSIICIFTAVVILWLPIYKTGRHLLGIFDLSFLSFLDQKVDLKPNMYHGLMGIILITPLYVRKILYWKETSVYSILSYILNLTLASTIVAVIMFNPDKKFTIFNIFPISDFRILILFAAMLLAWAGMRQFAGIAYIIVGLTGLLSIMRVGDAMGFYGYICVVTGTLGLILQNDMDPGSFFSSLKETYKEPMVRVGESIREIK